MFMFGIFKCVWPLLQVLNHPIPSRAISSTDFMPGTRSLGALQMMALVTASTGTKLGRLTVRPHWPLFSWLSSAVVLEMLSRQPARREPPCGGAAVGCRPACAGWAHSSGVRWGLLAAVCWDPCSPL